MKQNYLSLKAFIASLAICSLPFFAISCSSKSDSGAKTEEAQEKADEKPGKACTTIDKSSDSTLQAMIKSVVPQFKQLEYTDAQTGKTLKYNFQQILTLLKNILLSFSLPMQARPEAT